MLNILTKYQIVLIIIGICVLIGLGFTLSNPPLPSPIFIEAENGRDMIEKDPSASTPMNSPMTLSEIGSICTTDKSTTGNGLISSDISTDLSRTFTSVESFGIAGKDMIQAWSAAVESITDPLQKVEVGIQASQVGGAVTMANMATAMSLLTNIYTCSIIPERGGKPCNDTILSMMGADAKTTLEAGNRYTRTVVMRDDEKNTVYTIRGTIGDPGNIMIDIESIDGKSSIVTTRDNIGTETSSIVSVDSTLTVIENSNCSGKFILSGIIKSDISADITMEWQLTGEKTTGTLVSKSSDPIFNASYTW